MAPTLKPSQRIAQRRIAAARLSAAGRRLTSMFGEDSHLRQAVMARNAAQEIQHLLNWVMLARAEDMILLGIDLRGERNVLVELVRDLLQELRIALGEADDQEDDCPTSSAARLDRVVRAAEKASQICNYRSEQRLNGREVAAL